MVVFLLDSFQQHKKRVLSKKNSIPSSLVASSKAVLRAIQSFKMRFP